MHLGPNMRSVRELHGKTLQEVADKLRVDVSWLSLIERELRHPSQKLVKGWLRVFFMEEDALRAGSIAFSVFKADEALSGKVVRTG